MGRVRRVLRWVARGRSAGLRARLRRRLESLCGGAPAEEGRVPATAPPARPTAPAEPGVDVCGVDELPPGQIAEFVVDGVPVAVANVDGVFHAVSNVCPHAGGPLGDGELDGAWVACPLHGWRFDVRTGACEVVPDLSVTVFPSRASGGRVWVVLPTP